MKSEERDPAYLWDMLEAARSIVEFMSGISYEAFVENTMRRLAVERQLTVIGEAGRRVSLALRDSHPEIPWRDIIALRNLISHEYDRIDQRRIYVIATEGIPELVARLEPMVPEPPAVDET